MTLSIYWLVAALLFIVWGLISELTLKRGEETDWLKLSLICVFWPLTLVVIFIMLLAGVIKWVVATLKSNC